MLQRLILTKNCSTQSHVRSFVRFSLKESVSRSVSTTASRNGNMYSVIEAENRGKVLIATEDISPGQKIVLENPLLSVDKIYLNNCKEANQTEKHGEALSTLYKFRELSIADQTKYLSLFGPIPKNQHQMENDIREWCAGDNKLYDFSLGIHRLLSEQEKQLLVKLESIRRYNAFSCDKYPVKIYETITRMSHSCLPNCEYHTGSVVGEPLQKTVTSILPVMKGEELTIDYISKNRIQPTYVRRSHLLFSKEFTCHCARCSALGDDTRQFNCFDPRCSGHHLVCQPIKKEKYGSDITDLFYSGVEYVEPHLLPCNVCARAPLRSFEEDMLAMEKQLPVIGSQLNMLFQQGEKILSPDFIASNTNSNGKRQYNEMESRQLMLQMLKSIKYPTQHSLSRHILENSINILTLFPTLTEEGMQYHYALCKRYIQLYESILQFPNVDSLCAYSLVMNAVLKINAKNIAVPKHMWSLASECCEKGINIAKLLHMDKNAVKSMEMCFSFFQKRVQ